MLRHLGALGFLLFWILAASGIYLYLRFETSAEGAYDSIEGLERWFGGVLRSMHRYAADAFVIAIFAHLVRELAAGRFRGWRTFTWISGVPLLWLLYASGIVGYWLVWDARAQFSYESTLEMFGIRSEQGRPDRLFSLFVFLHIGLPLALLAGMWVHVQRLGRPHTVAPAKLTSGVILSLVALSLLLPARSEPHWQEGWQAATVAIDWFVQFLHPLTYAVSARAAWVALLCATALLLLLPYLGKQAEVVPAKVDAAHCSGCGRCAADCPYEAIVMEAGKAKVFESRCAACGICVGACPSSTPFRSVRELVSGIDLPDFTVHQLRERVRAALPAEEIVFCCERSGAQGIVLRCLGMLPPGFVAYARRHGARRVKTVGCRDGECAYRLGMALSMERLGP